MFVHCDVERTSSQASVVDFVVTCSLKFRKDFLRKKHTNRKMGKFHVLAVFVIFCQVRVKMLSDKESETCSWKTENDECCAFPFIYNGKSYDSCTTLNNWNTAWCSTTKNYDKDYKWGNCKPEGTSRENSKWTKLSGNLKQIDIGNLGSIWGVNKQDNIVRFNMKSWQNVNGALKHVSSGASGVWGVNSANNIFYRNGVTHSVPAGSSWTKVPGGFAQIDSGPSGIVYGVNKNEQIFCRRGITPNNPTGTYWIQVTVYGRLKYVSCGPFGCWGVNNADQIWLRKGVSSTKCEGNKWIHIPGSLKQIEVGPGGSVFGVNAIGELWTRDGITASHPTGSVWRKIPNVNFKHVSVGYGIIVALDKSGKIFYTEEQRKEQPEEKEEYNGPYTSGTVRYDECGRRCITTGTWSDTEKCYRQRKEFTSMSHKERVRYVKTIKTASSDPFYKPRYDNLITIHKKLFNSSIHNSTDFLPWHRWYILQYENLMREIDCKFTVSYWDWSLVAEDPFSSDLWKNGPDGFGGNGTDLVETTANETPMYKANCVTMGPFRKGQFTVVPYAGGGCLTRNFNSSKTTPNAIAVRLLILENPAVRFIEFEKSLRVVMHDEIHCVIGGIMCDEQSASAPEFFLHHAFVDKIWDDYQKQSFQHHAPGHLTSQKGKMNGTQYETKDFLNLRNMPGCVAVEYLPPKNPVFRLLQGLPKEQLKKVRTVPIPEVSEESRILFGVTKSQLNRLDKAETFFKSNSVVDKSELSGKDALLGFKLGDLEREAGQTIADVEEQMKREEILEANGQYFI